MTSSYKYLPDSLVTLLQELRFTIASPADSMRQGTYRSLSYGTSVEFAEYREYTPGDPTNLIDWSVYARSDKYMIRKSHKEVSIRGYILLDISESLNFKNRGIMTKFEYSCFLAAAFLFLLVRRQNSASLITFDSKIRSYSEQSASFDAVLPQISKLEHITPAHQSDIENALHEAAELIPPRSLVIIISDLLQEPEKIITGLRHIKFNRNEAFVFHISDPQEIAPAFPGLTELKELETGKRILIEQSEIEKEYKKTVERYLALIRQGSADIGVNYHFVDTSIPIEESIGDLACSV